MKRQKKKYSRPQKPFDKARIEEENIIKEKYGLKNKKEIWKADASIGRIRNLAKQLITAEEDDKKSFVERLSKKGFEVNSIADVLALNKEDWLKRRLQTIVFKKKLSNTPKQTRQLITHKHVSIGNQIVNIPSYQVSLEEEPLIKLNLTLKTAKKGKSKIEEIKEEIASSSEEEEGKKSAKQSSVKKAKVEEKPAEVPKVNEKPIEVEAK